MNQECSYSRIQWREIVAWLPVIGFLMVLSAIPFGWSDYQRIGLYVLGAGYFSDYIVNRRWTSLHWERGKSIYVVMLAFVAAFFIREWFDPTPLTSYAKGQFYLHEWYLYGGIAGLLGFSNKLQLKHVAYVMLATSVVMALTCADLYFLTDEHCYLSALHRFNTIRRNHINSHMVMNLYINTAIIFGFSILRSEPNKWRKAVLLVAIFCSWALIMLSDGRVGQATSLLIMVACGIYALPRRKWYIGLAVGALFAIGAGIALANNPRISYADISSDPRFAIYDYSWRMIEKKPVTGYGFSTLSIQYVEEAYQDSVMYNGFIRRLQSVPEFAQLGKTMKTHHAHNAFLHYWLALGIIGPVLLLALFGTAACLPIDRKYRFYLWLFLLALFIQCLTEPIGQHIKPHFIMYVLLVWQCAALPSVCAEKEETKNEES